MMDTQIGTGGATLVVFTFALARVTAPAHAKAYTI
jgi:hypothetical protein